MGKFIKVLVGSSYQLLSADAFLVAKASNTTITATTNCGVVATITSTSDATTATVDAFIDAFAAANSSKSNPDSVVEVQLPTGKTVSGIVATLLA